MADILTNGRVIFGVGRGYHSREVETFGSPMLDGDANRELFEEQDEFYRQETLRPETVRIGIEAAISMGWDRYLGSTGGFVGMAGYGASAAAKDLFKHFGITAEVVADTAKTKLAKQ